jgi:hypothetical protein
MKPRSREILRAGIGPLTRPRPRRRNNWDQSMSAILLTPPAAEPISLAESKFANAANFRGFPHLPGNDFVASYAVPGEPGHDGTPAR